MRFTEPFAGSTPIRPSSPVLLFGVDLLAFHAHRLDSPLVFESTSVLLLWNVHPGDLFHSCPATLSVPCLLPQGPRKSSRRCGGKRMEEKEKVA